LTGNSAVLRTWMPACCSPLNGVTTGAGAGDGPYSGGPAVSLMLLVER
jgi:hypothetical protein